MPAKKDSLADQARASDVERVRDIIVGPYVREMEQRLQALQSDIDRLQQLADRLGEQLAGSNESQAKRVQQEVDHLNRRLDEQDSAIRVQIQNVQKEVRQGDDSLRDELRQTTQRLSNDKTDRLALAELLIEVGIQLKGGREPASLDDLLETLGEDVE